MNTWLHVAIAYEAVLETKQSLCSDRYNITTGSNHSAMTVHILVNRNKNDYFSAPKKTYTLVKEEYRVNESPMCTNELC